MEPKIVERGTFVVVGIKYRGKNEQGEVPRLWAEFISRFREIKHPARPGGAYGVMGNYDKPMDGMGDHDEDVGEFDYMAGIEVDRVDEVPEGMETWEIPGQTYAVFTFPFAEIMKAYEYIYKTWLPASTYRMAAGPGFEFYPVEFDPKDEHAEISLFVPIESAACS